MTLKTVGERLGLTRERVRQIEKEALQNLRERLEAA
jgi:DNA-directed RNA polymerase sigma subunit (sigma70/sigma32)